MLVSLRKTVIYYHTKFSHLSSGNVVIYYTNFFSVEKTFCEFFSLISFINSSHTITDFIYTGNRNTIIIKVKSQHLWNLHSFGGNRYWHQILPSIIYSCGITKKDEVLIWIRQVVKFILKKWHLRWTLKVEWELIRHRGN